MSQDPHVLEAQEDPGPRSKLGPLLVAAGVVFVGGLALAGLACGWDSYGYHMVLGAPFVFGCALGFAFRLTQRVSQLLAALTLVALIAAILILGWAGTICMFTLLLLAAVPVVAGGLVGAWLRGRLRTQNVGRDLTLLSLLLATPIPGLYYEGLSRPDYTEELKTSRVLRAPASRVWESLVFYEEAPEFRSWVAKIGLPQPRYAVGVIDGVGDRKRCVYTTGHLVKLVTDYVPDRLLAFDVLEQVGIEDRSARLIDGSFELEPLQNGATRLTLTTRYRPLLQARPLWRPFERFWGHELHKTAIAAIQAGSEGPSPWIVRGDVP